MKNFISKQSIVGLAFGFACVTAGISVGHAGATAKVSSEMAKRLDGRLSTSMAFSGSGVKGQYQVPAEATARIENEKPLEELLGLRTQFRDRMAADKERTDDVR